MQNYLDYRSQMDFRDDDNESPDSKYEFQFPEPDDEFESPEPRAEFDYDPAPFFI